MKEKEEFTKLDELMGQQEPEQVVEAIRGMNKGKILRLYWYCEVFSARTLKQLLWDMYQEEGAEDEEEEPAHTRTLRLLHYDKVEGFGEYVVLTRDTTTENEDDQQRPGYKLSSKYDVDFYKDFDTLPLERALDNVTN